MLFIGDLHLTDHTRDEYRFKVFDWIRRQQEKHYVSATFLAGDLTNAKDRHSATLVNKTISGLLKLRGPVYICRGNHDYRDPDNPFFKFLSHIEGLHFVTQPTTVNHVAIIPHYREQVEFDEAIKIVSDADGFLVHQTFEGAIAESGARLSGFSASLIESFKPPLGVYAGDVHKPQRQGQVTYIGCPYHVRFGDGFNPRVLLVNPDGRRRNLYFDAPFKWSLVVRDADDIFNNKDLQKDDQVKLTVEVPREEAVDWKHIKAAILAACKEMDVAVYGCKMEIKSHRSRTCGNNKANVTDIFNQFCKVENVATNIRQVGKDLKEKYNGN